MKLIGIVGFIGSGKSTVADILVKDFAYTKISFADKLKDAVSVVFRWPRYLLEGDTAESREFREIPDEYWSDVLGYKATPRLILQKFGTEGLRQTLSDQIWIMSAYRTILEDTSKNYVFTDARFENEHAFIRSKGGIILRVKRGPEPEWYDLFLNKPYEQKIALGKALNIHESEWASIGSNFEGVIENDSSLEDLAQKVKEFVL